MTRACRRAEAAQNNLRGAIAHEIANLGHLRILDLSRNELECELVYELPQDGTVRPDFWDYFRCDLDDLKLLEEIDLSHNKLYTSTNVPPSFREMNALRRVDLSYNRLECWISADTWRPMFENGRTVDMILNGNRMFEKVHDFIQNHPEWTGWPCSLSDSMSMTSGTRAYMFPNLPSPT